MKWLQPTFANHFDGFRKVQGKLFQCRDKRLIAQNVVEDVTRHISKAHLRLDAVRLVLCEGE